MTQHTVTWEDSSNGEIVYIRLTYEGLFCLIEVGWKNPTLNVGLGRVQNCLTVKKVSWDGTSKPANTHPGIHNFLSLVLTVDMMFRTSALSSPQRQNYALNKSFPALRCFLHTVIHWWFIAATEGKPRHWWGRKQSFLMTVEASLRYILLAGGLNLKKSDQEWTCSSGQDWDSSQRFLVSQAGLKVQGSWLENKTFSICYR